MAASPQYGMFVARNGHSASLEPLASSAPPDVFAVIDAHLNMAMQRIKASHEDLMTMRASQDGQDDHPYVGVAEHMAKISTTLSALTTSLTQDSLRKQAGEFVLGRSDHGSMPIFEDNWAELENDMRQLKWVLTRYRNVADSC